LLFTRYSATLRKKLPRTAAFGRLPDQCHSDRYL